MKEAPTSRVGSFSRASPAARHACVRTGHRRRRRWERIVTATGTGSRRTRRKTGLRGVVALTAVAVLGLSACGGDDDAFSTDTDDGAGAGASKSLTVGGASFTEALILEQLYGQLLVKAGYTVDYKPADNRRSTPSR